MKQKILVAALVSGGLCSPLAHATNGMLMEGYGPIASGMGGASMAYDNGAAGMANNPATLGLMAEGDSRLDLAVGGLHPDIVARMAGMPDAKSGGTAYYMPAAGWVKKSGVVAYGVGMFAQGGMGTEYAANTWVGAGSGKPSRSEVSVGNLIVPVSVEVAPDLHIGGSLDFVWGGMDLQMAMLGSSMMGMMAAGNLTVTAPAPTMAMLSGFMAGPGNVGYFNFSDNSSFTGKANSTGYAGKLGMTYKLSDQVTMGATYHSRTNLGDMKAAGATVDLIGAGGVAMGTMTGDVTIVNFQFPETYGLGLAVQATDGLMIAADYKRIAWSKVMKDFHMRFTTANFGGVAMDMKMPQNWADQDVVSLGMAFRAAEGVTLRAGANVANNPVPANTVNPLFPATVTHHYTLGAGFAVSNVSQINASLSYVPKVTVTAPPASGGYSISHGQTNWQLMYSLKL